MAAFLKAHINQTPTATRTVDGITGPSGNHPGNVGVCLSGGGSRACTAGMGQLRALKHLTANGASLLSQVKAISTVSGGSWLGVTFAYLTDPTSDDAYLNTYVADPADLVPSQGTSVAVTLDQLPPGNRGEALNSRLFSIPALAVEAFLLWKFKQTPPEMLWQTLMGMHLLSPYDLHDSGDRALPTSFFSYDTKMLTQIRSENPALDSITGHLVASGPARTPRPYLTCNTSMFVNTPHDAGLESLAPVQATPWFTGIVSDPDGTDANGKPVGGGGVTSFAFNSELTSVDTADVVVSQSRTWSLTDIVGASSAAFAGELQKIFEDPDVLLNLLIVHFDEAVDWIVKKVGLNLPFDIDIPDFAKRLLLSRLVKGVDTDLTHIIPAYTYWPVLDASPDPSAQATRFADGGNLENTGICAMLTYKDIESIIAFVNSPAPMVATAHGVIDENGNEIPNSRIFVDGQLPPLFGYQPYDSTKGYVRFPANSTNVFSRSRVFAPEKFAELLQGLWHASENDSQPSPRRPATFRQELMTEQNDWFGVAGQRPVTLVWSYLNDAADWQDQLRDDVRQLIRTAPNFPNYPTQNTNLTNTQINLLSSLTAWSVAAPENSSVFTALFEPGN